MRQRCCPRLQVYFEAAGLDAPEYYRFTFFHTFISRGARITSVRCFLNPIIVSVSVLHSFDLGEEGLLHR